jgi:predicted dehydrogenase
MDLWKHETEEGHWQDPLVKRHVTLDGSRAYVNQLAHFMKVVTGDAKPLVSARDGMMTLATILAIARSSRERRPVNSSDL